MKHYIITNRQVKTRNGREVIVKLGHRHASDEIRLATIDSDTLDIDVFEDMEVDVHDTVDYSNNAMANKGSHKLFGELLELLNSPDEEVLLFIHGFGNGTNDIEKFCKNLHNQFVKGQNVKRRLLIFFWTTNGIKFLPNEYRNDAEDSKIAGKALAKFLLRWQQFIDLVNDGSPIKGKLHLLAQSMGNQVLQHTFHWLAKHEMLAQICDFSEVILTGADVKKNIFKDDFMPLSLVADRVHVYGNKKDRALKISSLIWLKSRLGQGYSKHEIAPGLDNVFCANVTEILKGSWQGTMDEIVQHWYFFTSDEVAADIRLVLQGGTSQYLL